MALSCSDLLVPSYQFLDILKDLNKECEVLSKYISTGNQDCDDIKFWADQYSLCPVMCCCDTEGKQSCAKKVFDDLNSKGPSHFKAEVRYYSVAGDHRTPDITIVKNPSIALPVKRSDPQVLWDNVEQILELKFTGDRWKGRKAKGDKLKQRDAYLSDLYFPKEKFNTSEISPNSCLCKDRKQQSVPVLEPAKEWFEKQEPSIIKKTLEKLGKSVPDFGSGQGEGKPWYYPDSPYPHPYDPPQPKPTPGIILIFPWFTYK